MINLSQLSGSTIDIEIGGESFKLSPLTLADVAIMQDWYCEKPMYDVASDIAKWPEAYSDKEKGKLFRQAKEKMENRRRVRNGLEPEDKIIEECKEDMNREFSSLDGVAKMFWLSLRKAQPELNEKDIRELVTLESVAMIKNCMDRMSFGAVDPDADLVAEVRGEKKTDGVIP